MPEEANSVQFAPNSLALSRNESLRWRGMWRHHWRDPEEKFTFAVCAVALAIVIAEVWFE